MILKVMSMIKNFNNFRLLYKYKIILKKILKK
jgi:hypothetical protein